MAHHWGNVVFGEIVPRCACASSASLRSSWPNLTGLITVVRLLFGWTFFPSYLSPSSASSRLSLLSPVCVCGVCCKDWGDERYNVQIIRGMIERREICCVDQKKNDCDLLLDEDTKRRKRPFVFLSPFVVHWWVHFPSSFPHVSTSPAVTRFFFFAKSGGFFVEVRSLFGWDYIFALLYLCITPVWCIAGATLRHVVLKNSGWLTGY